MSIQSINDYVFDHINHNLNSLEDLSETRAHFNILNDIVNRTLARIEYYVELKGLPNTWWVEHNTAMLDFIKAAITDLLTKGGAVKSDLAYLDSTNFMTETNPVKFLYLVTDIMHYIDDRFQNDRDGKTIVKDWFKGLAKKENTNSYYYNFSQLQFNDIPLKIELGEVVTDPIENDTSFDLIDTNK